MKKFALFILATCFVACIGVSAKIIEVPNAISGVMLLGGSPPAASTTTTTVSDGSVGTSSHDGTEGLSVGYPYGDYFTASAGTVNYAHVYISASGESNESTICISLMDGGTQIAYGSVTGVIVTGWQNITLNDAEVITAKEYWLWIQVVPGTAVGLSVGTNAASHHWGWLNTGLSYDCDANITKNADTADSENLTILINNTSGSPE